MVSCRKSKSTKRATVKDVSAFAGVSTATVSRVLAGMDGVSDLRRQQVLDAIKTLNYQPNRNARNLRKSTMSKIGVIISDIQNPFFGSVVRGIEKNTIKDDLTLFLGNADEDPQREQKIIAMFLEEGVAGIILAPTSPDPENYLALINSGTPLVIIDRFFPVEDVDRILVDGEAGVMVAVDYLVELGHTKIAYVGGLQYLSVMQAREQGYLSALTKHKLLLEEKYLRQGNNRQSGGYAAITALTELDDPPSAVLIANNMMTLGGLQAIHELGLDIPNHLSVIGFDDMDWAPSLRPPLTVIAQPAFTMGELAGAILLDRINDPDQPHQTYVLNTQLIIRASCCER